MARNKNIKVALLGCARAGKDTVGDYLVTMYDFEGFSFASGIKHLTSSLFGVETALKNREMTIAFGELARHFDEDVWIKHLLVDVEDYDDVVITDVRRANEVKRLVEDGFTIIAIDTDSKVRYEREDKSNKTYEEFVEMEQETLDLILNGHWHYCINTDGKDIPTMLSEVDNILEQHKEETHRTELAVDVTKNFFKEFNTNVNELLRLEKALEIQQSKEAEDVGTRD